jgi:hypothetical protein
MNGTFMVPTSASKCDEMIMFAREFFPDAVILRTKVGSDAVGPVIWWRRALLLGGMPRLGMALYMGKNVFFKLLVLSRY